MTGLPGYEGASEEREERRDDRGPSRTCSSTTEPRRGDCRAGHSTVRAMVPRASRFQVMIRRGWTRMMSLLK